LLYLCNMSRVGVVGVSSQPREGNPAMDAMTIHTKVDPADIATEMAHQMQDPEVLEFLGKLDEAMASWDFTQKAAELFVRTTLQIDGEISEDDSAKATLARLAEFSRQAKSQPHVTRDLPVLVVWSDPQTTAAELRARDLDRLIELAAISLAKGDKPC